MFPYKNLKRCLTIFNYHRILHGIAVTQFKQSLSCFFFVPLMKNAAMHVLTHILLPYD